MSRYQNEALIDIGKYDTDFKDTKIAVIKKDKLVIQKDGIGVTYSPEDLLGYFEPARSEEDLTEGYLKLSGYYDRMNKDDSVILLKKTDNKKESSDYVNFMQTSSYLLSLLRKIR